MVKMPAVNLAFLLCVLLHIAVLAARRPASAGYRPRMRMTGSCMAGTFVFHAEARTISGMPCHC